MTEARQWSQWW